MNLVYLIILVYFNYSNISDVRILNNLYHTEFLLKKDYEENIYLSFLVFNIHIKFLNEKKDLRPNRNPLNSPFIEA